MEPIIEGNSPNTDRIPFARPDITDSEVRAVTEVLESGWITTGKVSHAFENEFRVQVDAPFALAVNSATAGLHLALEAMSIGAGDAVVVPTLTFSSCAAVVDHLGATPAFADVDPETGMATPETMRRAAQWARSKGLRVAALMPVHFAGQACDMDGIEAVATEFTARVVEDAAHALPTTYKGKKVGSISEFTAFSFYATKTITTAEGGMVTTTNSDAKQRMTTMRLHGMDREAWDRYLSEKPAWYYETVAPGFKYNLPDITAALGRVQLQRSPAMHQRRLTIANRYATAFEGSRFAPLRVMRPDDVHAWHLFVVRVDPSSKATRNDAIAALAEAGIGTSVHFIPLHRMPYFRDSFNLQQVDYPGAEEYFRTCLSLPIYSSMTDHQVERVIAAAMAI